MIKQIKANEAEILNFANTFSAISAEAANLAKNISQSNLYCEEGVKALNKITYPNKQFMQETIKRHPSVLAIELQKDAAKKQMEVFKIERRPSLSLQVGSDRINNVAPATAYNDHYVGISFSYQ